MKHKHRKRIAILLLMSVLLCGVRVSAYCQICDYDSCTHNHSILDPSMDVGTWLCGNTTLRNSESIFTSVFAKMTLNYTDFGMPTSEYLQMSMTIDGTGYANMNGTWVTTSIDTLSTGYSDVWIWGETTASREISQELEIDRLECIYRARRIDWGLILDPPSVTITP